MKEYKLKFKKPLFFSLPLLWLGCNNGAKHGMYPHAIYAKAYPDYIKGNTETAILWKDGTEMPVSDGKEGQKTFLEKLNNPSLLDQISSSYKVGRDYKEQNEFDPGRFRNMDFFKKMYGQTKEEVEKQLVSIEWLPKSLKKEDGSLYTLRVTPVNGVSEVFKKLSEALDDLPDDCKAYLKKPSGTFNWRYIAGTKRQSAHSFGMTVDIDASKSNYWSWDYKKEQGINREENLREEDVDYSKFPDYRNDIPLEIIEVFEKHKFIWGGKWRHYDTMHFEYRPELFPEHFQDDNVQVSGAHSSIEE